MNFNLETFKNNFDDVLALDNKEQEQEKESELNLKEDKPIINKSQLEKIKEEIPSKTPTERRLNKWANKQNYVV